MAHQFGEDRIPLVRAKGCLLVSIQAALHDHLLQVLSDDIAEAMVKDRPDAVVLDLSFVGFIDSYTTRVVNDIGMMVRLMGGRVCVVGIQPAVAITMVEMGIELAGIETYLGVDEALDAIGIGHVGTPVAAMNPEDDLGLFDTAAGVSDEDHG